MYLDSVLHNKLAFLLPQSENKYLEPALPIFTKKILHTCHLSLYNIVRVVFVLLLGFYLLGLHPNYLYKFTTFLLDFFGLGT